MAPSSFQLPQIEIPPCFLRASLCSSGPTTTLLLPTESVLTSIYSHQNFTVLFFYTASILVEKFTASCLDYYNGLFNSSSLLLCWQVKRKFISSWGMPVSCWIQYQPLSLIPQVRPKESPHWHHNFTLHFPNKVEYLSWLCFPALILWFTFFSQCEATSLQPIKIVHQMLFLSWNLFQLLTGWMKITLA